MAGSIIYYGGSFNPPHIAHYLFVAALRAYFPEAEIWVAPTFSHAFNKKLMPYDLRIAMLEAMFAPINGVKISQIEKELDRTPTYTVDVVRLMRSQGIESEIYLAVGADIVPTLGQWHGYEELKKLAKFLVFPREGCENTNTFEMPHLPDISSSQIRAWIADGRWDLVKPWMPALVFEMLQTKVTAE